MEDTKPCMNPKCNVIMHRGLLEPHLWKRKKCHSETCRSAYGRARRKGQPKKPKQKYVPIDKPFKQRIYESFGWNGYEKYEPPAIED